MSSGPADVELLDLGEHRLRDLSRPERVFQLVVGGLEQSFAPLRSIDVMATNLPVQLTSFVGRTSELKALAKLSTGHRIRDADWGGWSRREDTTRAPGRGGVVGAIHDGAWIVELSSVEAPRGWWR